MNDKNHQAALDGIRGFAAISVVLFHIGHWLDAPLAPNSFLAVDLFFLLSGYVLTLAYAGRLDAGMKLSSFVALRLVRLMPLVILGTIISAAYTLLRIQIKNEDLSLASLATATVFGILNLPYLTAPIQLGGGQIFPLNGPQFSLFLEVVINITWAGAALLRQKSTASVISMVCLIFVLSAAELGGDTTRTFIDGFPRVGASFLGGVVIFYIDRVLTPWRWWPTIFWICFLIMLGTFYAPELSPAYQIVWIATVSPMLVLSGSRTTLRGQIRSLALIGGKLSYPIYVLHYPMFVWINCLYQFAFKKKDVVIEAPILLGLIILVSAVILKIYDEPMRRKLTNRFKGSTQT